MLDIKFGKEVFIGKYTYKLSTEALDRLERQYGHCLSTNQVNKLYQDLNYESTELIQIKKEDLVIDDIVPKIPAVIIDYCPLFNVVKVKAHCTYNLYNTIIRISEGRLQHNYYIKHKDIGIEFKHLTFDSEWFLVGENKNPKYENGFYKV